MDKNIISKVKKSSALLLLTAMIVTQPAEAVQAGTMYKVKNVDNYLALRTEKAYDSSNEIGRMYNGDTVWVESKEEGDYWKVYSKRNGKYGYTNKNYLTKKKVSNVKKVVIHYGYLALRSSKSYSVSNEIGELYTGDIVIVKDKKDPLYWKVYSPKYETYGYVNKNYLKSKKTFKTKYVSISSEYLAMRSGKRFEHNSEIGRLYDGDAVDVIQKFNMGYWYVYSPEQNKYGFVSKDHLVSKKDNTEWTVHVSKGYLALRRAREYNGENEIGRLFLGDKVNVIEKNSQYWYVYSERLDKYGYVNKNYLVQDE